MKKVVNAIDLILTNQRNDFLIQWEEGKTRQPKRCKDKLYAEIRCQISRYGCQKKYVLLPPCTTSFRETMQLPCAHELAWLIYQDKPISIEYIHWHWRFTRCPDWDPRESQKGQRMRKYHGNPESEPTPSPPPQHTSPTENQHSSSARENRFSAQPRFLQGAFPPPRNFHEDEGSPNSEIHDSETDSSQNTPSQPTNNSSRTAAIQAVFPLDPRLKEIQEPLVVKPRGRPSGSVAPPTQGTWRSKDYVNALRLVDIGCYSSVEWVSGLYK